MPGGQVGGILLSPFFWLLFLCHLLLLIISWTSKKFQGNENRANCSFSIPILFEIRAHLMGCNGRIMKNCKWGKQRTGQVIFFSCRQGETPNIRPLWNPKISINHHLEDIPNTTVKTTVCETPWKKSQKKTAKRKKNNLHSSLQECNKPVLPFPHCCLLLWEQLQEQHCLRLVACARGRCSGSLPDVLGKQRCWQCPASPHGCTQPPPHAQTAQDPCILDVSAEMLVNSHMEMAPVHALGQF